MGTLFSSRCVPRARRGQSGNPQCGTDVRRGRAEVLRTRDGEQLRQVRLAKPSDCRPVVQFRQTNFLFGIISTFLSPDTYGGFLIGIFNFKKRNFSRIKTAYRSVDFAHRYKEIHLRQNNGLIPILTSHWLIRNACMIVIGY